MPAYYEPGKYRVRVVNQKLGENTKGNPEVQITVQPLGIYGQNGQVTKMDYPYTRTIFMVLTEGTIGTPEQPGWVLLTLQHMGFAGQNFAELDTEAEGHWSCIGKEYDAICSHEEYEGKERERWGIHRPNVGGGVAHKALEKKSLKALNAKFGKVLKAMAKSVPDPQRTTEPVPDGAGGDLPPPPAGRNDDDIPF